jgi:chromate transporter
MKKNESHSSVIEVFGAFLKLGLTSFGGPVAHLAFFRQEFVERRRWIGEQSYADLVALCQFLPGPASSQVGFAIGQLRAGLAGGLAAWLAFTAPSATALALFAMLLQQLGVAESSAWLHGLKIVAVAVVAQAVWSMGRTLCPDRPRATIAILSAAVLLVAGHGLVQLAVLALGAVTGLLVLRPEVRSASSEKSFRVPTSIAVLAWLLFFFLLFALPIAARTGGGLAIQLFDAFYRAGALVFGGGHVVLPLLQGELVPRGWISNEAFLAGYGAAQAVPGPLFSFAAYLGAVIGGVGGAVLCTIALFLPGLLLVTGALPFWEKLRGNLRAQSAMAGVNSAVVGLLLAALYDPMLTNTIGGPHDAALALAAFGLLVFWRVSPPLLAAAAVLVSALAAWL